jgi:hypothetical protein
VGIKVTLDVQLWIPKWAKPSLWVTVNTDRSVAPDYMRLGVMEVELPIELPTEEAIKAYRTRVNHETLLEAREQVQAELNRLNDRLNKELRDAYEITGQADLEDDVLGGR